MSPSTALATAPAQRSRLDALLPAALMVAGTVAFFAGGVRHPHVNASLGPMGSDEFYRGFAHTILHTPNWESMHAMILAGPVLWALGAAGLARLLPGRAAAFGEVGRTALLLGAGLWAIVFVLDGFVAPSLARTIEGAAASAGELRSAFTAFQVNQRMVGRLGMVSMVLLGAAESALATAVLLSARGARSAATAWRATVGVAGLLVGLWPLVAALRGEFSPAPFTSPYWSPTALSTGLWFVALATAVHRSDESAVAGAAESPRTATMAVA
jgi:hypothetical protein